MTNRGDQFDAPGFIVNDEVDELFGHANPNPNRIGCPPREVLSALARRERPMDDPAYEHLANCSPCYQEFRASQHRGVPQRELAARSHLKWIAAVAAIAALVAVGAWFYVRTRDSGREPGQTPAVAEVQVQLDLRPYAVSRSPQGLGTQPQLVLPQGRVVLTMLLPSGSEPGPYDVQIRNAASQVLASATGPAEIRDFVTTLRLPIDLGPLPARTYQLAVRRQGEDWRFFPVTVR